MHAVSRGSSGWDPKQIDMQQGKLIDLMQTGLKLAFLIFFVAWFIAAGQPMSPRTGNDNNRLQSGPPQELLSADERAQLSERALKHLQRSPSTKHERLRVLGIRRLPAEKSNREPASVSVLVFNYSKGSATRLIMDLSNGAVLREERLRGRPQPSEEELEEARLVIRSDADQARMLHTGSIIEGGFVVDAPKGQSIRDRCLLFQVLSSDRKRLERDVIVNLTTGRIVESRAR